MREHRRFFIYFMDCQEIVMNGRDFLKIEYYAKKYNFIIIMPEVQRSFYTTGKVGIDYFHYVADELPAI